MRSVLSNLYDELKKRTPLTNFLFISTIVLLTWYSFSPALDNNFLFWDDQFYVTANPDIINPTVESFKSNAAKIVSLNYHPLTMWSLWANAKLSSLNSARPFILTNVILHILNALMVFVLAHRASNSKRLVALCAALIFALHPMHVESVVWVSERKDVLYSFFFLASILSYWKYSQCNRVAVYCISLVLFIMSCLSKATAVSLVPCLFLVDYLTGRDFRSWWSYVDKLPFVIIALVIGLISLSIQDGGSFMNLLQKAEATNAYNASIAYKDRILNACYAHYYYLTSFILPSSHSAFHPYSLITNYNLWHTVVVAVLTLVTSFWALMTKRREVFFGLGFYGFTIFLLLQFIPVGSALVAERYTYLAYIGFAFLVGLVLHYFYDQKRRLVSIILLVSITTFCIQSTRAQVDKWQNHTTLFEQACAKYPEDASIRKTLAAGYWAEGRLDEALSHIRFAVEELGLATSDGFELLANCYFDLGNTETALFYFDQAVEVDPGNISARYHRGLSLLEVNNKKAIEDFDYCEASGNAYILPLIYGPRGRAYGLEGNYIEAIIELTKAIELFPEDHNSYLDRAISYENNGNELEAIVDYEKVLALDPSNTYAAQRLAQLTNAD